MVMATCALVEIRQGAELRSWPLIAGRTYTVGRNSCGADIEVDHATLSRKHCSFLLEGVPSHKLFVTVTDLGSTNGTFLNGKRLDKGDISTSSYNPDHIIGFGECKDAFKVVVRDEELATTVKDAATSKGTGDWSGNNKRYGIEFKYDDDSAGHKSGRRRSRSRKCLKERRMQPRRYSRSRRRSQSRRHSRSRRRSPSHRRQVVAEKRQQRAEEERRKQREKRKALWSGTNAANCEGTVDTSATVTPKTAGAGSANGWEASSFASASQKDKFMKLMGGKSSLSADNGGQAAAITTDAVVPLHRQRDLELERQYWQGIRQHHGRGRGLGAV